MEASVATPPEAPPEPEAAHDGQAEATRSAEELFQWSTFVHVGADVEDCEHRTDGECDNERHFHAWVRLPNSFQVRDIVDKARAAKARKVRALRDSESDAYAIMESELDELRRDRYGELTDAIARANVEKNLPDLIRELNEDERFEHQAQDAEEYQRLQELPEDDRDPEEYERLQKDMMAYGEALQETIDGRVEREIERLKQLPTDEVVEMERSSRIEQEGMEAYLFTYYTWAMFVGTRTKGMSSERKFARPEDLKDAAPEVTRALREALRRLEERTTARGDAAGNS